MSLYFLRGDVMGVLEIRDLVIGNRKLNNKCIKKKLVKTDHLISHKNMQEINSKG